MNRVVGIFGNKEAARVIKKLGKKYPVVLARQLYREGNEILTAAKKLVPVDQGPLRDSGGIELKQAGKTKSRPVVRVYFGGPAATYAIKQHETPPPPPPGGYRHDPGQSWKYLEIPATRQAHGMSQRLAAALRKKVRL